MALQVWLVQVFDFNVQWSVRVMVVSAVQLHEFSWIRMTKEFEMGRHKLVPKYPDETREIIAYTTECYIYYIYTHVDTKSTLRETVCATFSLLLSTYLFSKYEHVLSHAYMIIYIYHKWLLKNRDVRTRLMLRIHLSNIKLKPCNIA